jgi:hypothetical protein
VESYVMTDLEQAIEAITEGGQALGVSCEDVYLEMTDDRRLMVGILEQIHQGSDCQELFSKEFDWHVKHLLKKALRTKQEQEAGL